MIYVHARSETQMKANQVCESRAWKRCTKELVLFITPALFANQTLVVADVVEQLLCPDFQRLSVLGVQQCRVKDHQTETKMNQEELSPVCIFCFHTLMIDPRRHWISFEFMLRSIK